jgi:hypothetical protein
MRTYAGFLILSLVAHPLNAWADPLQDFSSCIENLTSKAMTTQPSIQDFNKIISEACRLEELAVLNYWLIKDNSLADKPEMKQFNADMRTLGERYVKGIRQNSEEAYAKWAKWYKSRAKWHKSR